MENYFLLFVVAGAVAIVLWFPHRDMDNKRIARYIAAKGGKLHEVKWLLLGPGWLDRKEQRIYEVRYRDRDGGEHVACCKTSGWSGVCFTEDRVVQQAEHSHPTLAALEEENRQLREELAKIKADRP